MWIERNYKQTILKAYKFFPCIYLGGPRQAGKTSLLRKLFSKAEYISLDIPSIAEQAENNPELLIKDTKNTIIIDEIQYAPSLFRYLKSQIDKNKISGRFILSGSQNFLLMKNVSESLAGRCAIISINSLSSIELLNAKLINRNDFLKFILKGGFPELWANPNFPQDLWFSSYISTYLERDIRNILNVGNLRDFDRFLRAVAIRTSQILSYSQLARDVGISVSTAKEWISTLVTSNQVIILEPFHKSMGKRIFKSPKIYLSDTGLACFLLGINSTDTLFNSPLIGALWETFVIGQIHRSIESSGSQVPIWFFRKQDGTEVDFVIEQGGTYHLFECKFSSKPDNKSNKGFSAFENFYGKDTVKSKSIVCTTLRNYKKNDVNVVNGLSETFKI